MRAENGRSHEAQGARRAGEARLDGEFGRMAARRRDHRIILEAWTLNVKDPPRNRAAIQLRRNLSIIAGYFQA
jgi:hypothetical protein